MDAGWHAAWMQHGMHHGIHHGMHYGVHHGMHHAMHHGMHRGMHRCSHAVKQSGSCGGGHVSPHCPMQHSEHRSSVGRRALLRVALHAVLRRSSTDVAARSVVGAPKVQAF